MTELELFRPDLVFISAGFDAHAYDPLASCDLLDEDFRWATDAVRGGKSSIIKAF